VGEEEEEEAGRGLKGVKEEFIQVKIKFQRRKQISNHAPFPAYIIGVDVPELCLKPAWN
jgi:hypothetical protein